MTNTRPYHVVLWGATGFTGRLVAEYFAKNAPPTLSWAIGGRSESKLQEIKKVITEINPQKDVDILVGEITDQSSIDRIVEKTLVLLSTAGPFDLYGTPIVDACVRLKTDYCDITGESPWIKKIIEKYHQQAEDNSVWIVPCSGFDSIPSDLGAFMTVNYIWDKYKVPTRKVHLFVTDVKGGFSGGTLASIFNIMEKETSTLREMQDPYYLNPPNVIGTDGPDRMTFSYNRYIKSWIAPSIMASINNRVVRRSWGLFQKSYGPRFSYDESMTGSVFVCMVMTFFMSLFFFAAFLRPTRYVLKKLLPAPGQGPTRKEIETGRFTCVLIGETDEVEPRYVKGVVKGVNDPGYGETSKMLSETAICLALNREALRKDYPGGILTTACLGNLLIDRLKAADMTFEVSDYNL